MFFHLYGFFIALGILVAAWISEKYRKTLNTKHCILNTNTYDLLPWVLIPGIIGARLYHVLDYWQYYSENAKEIFMVWQGGLGIFGGIIGSGFGLYLYCFFAEVARQKFFVFESHAKKLKNFPLSLGRDAVNAKTEKFLLASREKISFKRINRKFLILLDLAAIGLPVGQAIGRLGNYFNQELYGLPTNLPWGIYVKPESRVLGYEGFERFHPLFAYEGLWCLIIFIILLKTLNTKYCILNTQKSKNPTTKTRCFKSGELFFTYLGLYSFGRFWLEFLRIESWMIPLPFTTILVRVAQLISLGLMIVSSYFLVRTHLLHSY